ncbi:putative RNA-directed DNA polymerase from transposon X-element [Araneus ventricosus]|uniref:Putative RNA-directed DNA polymerase from transposon X-element n=1 Tax=Araneus ventricosus TaxID=182803 RepID=A0A4Y2E3Z3_ARAVE|nr:putative RNA-directed DNA polymerase from transposon X-element [Araneus ventricosus]
MNRGLFFHAEERKVKISGNDLCQVSGGNWESLDPKKGKAMVNNTLDSRVRCPKARTSFSETRLRWRQITPSAVEHLGVKQEESVRETFTLHSPGSSVKSEDGRPKANVEMEIKRIQLLYDQNIQLKYKLYEHIEHEKLLRASYLPYVWRSLAKNGSCAIKHQPTNQSYNSSFSFLEFQSCLASVHDSSPGPDSITYSMIKHLTTESQNALLHFYNRIWQEQYFPTLWQQAIIIPLLKPGKDPKNPSNYRPIALNCCLCKLLERMINRRLVYYLEANKYLHPFQSGFRKGRSTTDNLLALETDIRLSFLQRKHLVAIFFDIEKAYDWRYGILKDSHDLGLRGNLPTFIKNFLKLRKFRVKVESEFSDFFIQEEGVPQGSVLSVTLFILKINNILKQLPTSVRVFKAEIAAVLLALEKISDCLERKFIIYNDSLSVLESLKSFYMHSHHHPLVLNVLHLLNKLASRDFNILLCWVPSHVGIVGNEKADKAAKLATAPTNSSTPLTDFKKYIKLLFYTKWQRQWDTETDNKLHSVKPHVPPWPSLTTRKADTLLTKLRVGHTRYTHRHLLFGEQTPMCSQCNCSMSVKHILSECPNFNSQRLKVFKTNSVDLSLLLGKTPHVNLFAFLRSIGFYPHI